jgi:hypothetical protein
MLLIIIFIVSIFAQKMKLNAVGMAGILLWDRQAEDGSCRQHFILGLFFCTGINPGVITLTVPNGTRTKTEQLVIMII